MDSDTEYDSTPSVSHSVYSVSELNNAAKEVIENNFPLIWVEGEISNLARPASGHLYFTLKDEAAQVRCAMFRMRNRLLNFTPANGMQVLMRAQVGFYESRGEFQLIAEHMEEAGTGALRRKFEILKRKLGDEGLFDESCKVELPEFPQRIGVITSPSGAAIRDILSVLRRRFPAIKVVIYPVPVQGDSAASEIARMIRKADSRKECDVLILARGGGSLEDLWSFNEEVVARAVADCVTPIVCGIGHETDFTIADFVADVRAPTPSAAAELVSPNQDEWLDQLSVLQRGFVTRIIQTIAHHQQRLSWLSKRLRHPKQRLQTQAQHIDDLEQRLLKAHIHFLRHAQAKLLALTAKFMQSNPSHYLRQLELQRISLAKRLEVATKTRLDLKARQLAGLAHSLDAMSPLATLKRGYSIARTNTGDIVRRADQLAIGDRIVTELAGGKVGSTVYDIQHE